MPIRKKNPAGSHIPTSKPPGNRSAPSTGVVPGGSRFPRTSVGAPALLFPARLGRSTATANPPTQPFPPELVFPTVLYTTPTAPNRRTIENPPSAGSILSDTTEWDPNMVTPSKMDPNYRPTPLPTAFSPPRPPAYVKKQKLNPHQNGSLPALGMFPTKPFDPHPKMTQNYSIPLDFSRVAGSGAGAGASISARSANIHHAGTSSGQDYSVPGREIPPSLLAVTPALTRMMTRSSSLLQPLLPPERPVQTLAEGALAPVHGTEKLVAAQDSVSRHLLIGEIEAQHQERKFAKPRAARQVAATEMKQRRQEVPRVAEQPTSSVPHMYAPVALVKLPHSGPPELSLPATVAQVPKYLGRVADNPQTAVDPASKYLQRIAANPPTTSIQPGLIQKGLGTNESDLERILGQCYQTTANLLGGPGVENKIEPSQGPKYLERVNGNPLAAASQVPKHLGQAAVGPQVVTNGAAKHIGRIVENPPVAITHPVPVQKNAKPTSWITREGSYGYQDPTNPNFGTTRPGVESPDYFDYEDPAYFFLPSRGLRIQEWTPAACGSTPEPETPLTSRAGSEEDTAMGEEGPKEVEISGSTPTSYSQRPGSPNSLICMYRAHGDLNFDKRKGLSLLHTKRPYIGEKAMLGLDIPQWGDGEVMGMEEMEMLMDDMIDGGAGAEVKLASADRDRETGGRCTDGLEYVEWR